MTNQKEKVLVNELKLGMFIDELDRPWLESPFLLQGFVLEDDEQLLTIKNLCEFVYVDRTRSIGNQYSANAKLDVAIKREVSTVKIYPPKQTGKNPKKETSTKLTSPKVMVRTRDNQKKTLKQSSFFEVISAIKNGSVTQTEDGIIFNMRVGGSDDHYTTSNDNDHENTTNSTHDKLSFFRNLFGSKKEKLKTSVKETAGNDENPFGITESEIYRITVYENEVPPVEQEMAIIYPTFEKSQIATKAMFEAIADKKNLDISTVSEVLDSMVDSISRTPDALMWLAKLKDTDNIAYGQALNVSINMMAFASFLAFPKQQIKEMGLAGLLQDIGKVKIPQRILQKKSKLSATEYEVAKLHIEEGLKILKSTPDIPLLAFNMIAQHHERINGSGYPNQLEGDELNINGQIAGLIDTYCAITTDRSYAPSMANLHALDEIHQMRGVQFSTEIVDQLIQFFGIYPVSTLVELNTGEVAVVIQQNQVRRLLPRLMVVLSPDKTKNEFPATLDLLHSPKTPSGETYQIVKGIPPDSYGINISDFYF
jgi:HD-GYP domain-containing protein (c-di-GMP phosphodiesterase class II)